VSRTQLSKGSPARHADVCNHKATRATNNHTINRFHSCLHVYPSPLCSSSVATSGYKVTCDNSGNSGTFSVCNADCSACSVNTPFNSQSGASECIDNPAASGSSSVRFTCAEPTTTAANSAKKTGGLATAAVFASILVAMLSYIYMG